MRFQRACRPACVAHTALLPTHRHERRSHHIAFAIHALLHRRSVTAHLMALTRLDCCVSEAGRATDCCTAPVERGGRGRPPG